MRTRWLAGAVVGAMALAACGSTGSDDADTTVVAEELEESATTTAPPEEVTPEPPDDADDSDDSEPTAEPIRIGWVNTDEGISSYPAMTLGAEVAVDFINGDLGGVAGRPLELVTCSVGLDEASVAACAQELANDQTLAAIVTGMITVSGPFYETTSQQGWTVLGSLPLSAADFAAPDTYFYASGVLGQVSGGAVFVTEAFPDAAEVAVVYIDIPAAAAAVDISRSVLEPAGIQVTAVPVPVGGADFTVPLTAAGADSADVLLVFVDDAGCIQTARALAQLGIDTPVVSGQNCSTDGVLVEAADAVDGWYYVEAGPTPRQGRGVDDDVDVYLDAWEVYGTGAPTQTFSAYAWGTLLALYEVLSELDAFDRDTVAAAIPTFTGPVPLGARTIACPGALIPAVCTTEARVFELSADGTVEDPLDGRYITAG